MVTRVPSPFSCSDMGLLPRVSNKDVHRYSPVYIKSSGLFDVPISLTTTLPLDIKRVSLPIYRQLVTTFNDV